MKRFPLSLLVGLATLAFVACTPAKGPSPMRNDEIYSTQLLKVGLIDFGTDFDRRGLERCPDEFPGIEVVTEASLVAGWRKEGILPERLLQWGENFSSFRTVRGLHLLFLVFEEGSKRYLRSVNYLRQTVSTVILDVSAPRCDELLRKERVAVVDSHPPIADVTIDGRKVGEAPVWVGLRTGTYEVGCLLPGQIFKPMTLTIPGAAQIVCQRENTSSAGAGADQPDELSGEEKAGSALVYIVGAAATLAAIVIPLLFLF